MKKLKAITDIFLRFCQEYNSPDLRYDAFFATILKSVNEETLFPKNVNILSWNYDNQIEYSLMDFFNKSHKTLLVNNEKFNFFPNSIDFNNSLGSIIKINGQAFGQVVRDSRRGELKETGNFENLMFDSFGKADITKLNLDSYVEKYNFLIGESTWSTIEYAWESTPLITGFREIAKKATKGTEVLVIIGYSFPNFNRTIDKMLIRDNMPNLKKVYIQSPEETTDAVVERFRALPGRLIDIKKVTYTDEFCIPDEMDLTY